MSHNNHNELAEKLRKAARVNRAADQSLARLLDQAADALQPRPPIEESVRMMREVGL